jgi:N-glycosylase/DNA lyase
LENASTETFLRVRDYDLAATLDSGQAFRWQPCNDSWVGVIGQRWVRLTQRHDGILAETAGPVAGWQWLRDYLQTETDLDAVLKTFPDDAPMRDAVAACRGLRVLRQDPWECLASFILSSTKQIVQIRQIVALLCERFGEPIIRPAATPPMDLVAADVSPLHLIQSNVRADSRRLLRFGGSGLNENHLSHSFPTTERLASVTEAELRACKMGFRAPHLLAAAAKLPIASCSSPMVLTVPFPWTSGLSALCASFIFSAAGSVTDGCGILPQPISGFTPATPSNIFFITCGRK